MSHHHHNNHHHSHHSSSTSSYAAASSSHSSSSNTHSAWQTHSNSSHSHSQDNSSQNADYEEEQDTDDARTQEEEPEQCPLCMEELDLTDLSFRPCKCGYQICLWCFHQICNQNGEGQAKCPACRTPFDTEVVRAAAAPAEIAQAAQSASIAQQSAQRALIKKKNVNAGKERTLTREQSIAASKDMSNNLVPIEGAGMTPLSEVRIVQRNLCIARGTLINTSSGTSQPIETVTPHHSVLAYDAEHSGLCTRHVERTLDQGRAECIELTFTDKRTLTCTPEHRILTPEGEWREAQHLKAGESYVAVGVLYAASELEQKEDEGEWNVELQGMTLNMTQSNKECTLSFARLLGYIHSQRVTVVNESITLIFTHRQDVIACMDDLVRLNDSNAVEPLQMTETNDEFHLALPASLASTFLPLLDSAACSSILSTSPSSSTPSTPRSFLREYLAALLSGASSVFVNENALKGDLVLELTSSTQHSLRATLIILLDRLSIAHRLDTLKFGEYLHILDSASFAQSIGFRYAAMQQLRMNVLAGIAQAGLSVEEGVEEFQAREIVFGQGNKKQSKDILPLYRIQLASVRSVGLRDVFDLSVPTHSTSHPDGSFTAGSFAVHNCYVVGLSSACGRDDLLRKRDFFGAFGRCLKVACTKSFAAGTMQHATYACYITYKEKADAAEAIKAVNYGSLGLLLAKGSAGAGESEPPRARASYGTTKYCSAWLRGSVCQKNNCMYLHALATLNDCCTKDQLQRDRFEERFGVGPKAAGTSNVVHAIATTIAPPPEMLRSVSQPVHHMAPASSPTPALAPSPLAQPTPTPTPIKSFASVALGAVAQQAPSVSPTDMNEDFPPLMSSSNANNNQNNSKQNKRQLSREVPAVVTSVAPPAPLTPEPTVEEPSVEEVEPVADEPEEEPATADSHELVDTADDDVPTDVEDVDADVDAGLVATPEPLNLSLNPSNIEPPSSSPPFIDEAQAKAQAQALEDLFTRGIRPIQSNEQVPSMLGQVVGLQNPPIISNKSVIRPPPGFGAAPLGSLIRSSTVPPGFHMPTSVAPSLGLYDSLAPTSFTSASLWDQQARGQVQGPASMQSQPQPGNSMQSLWDRDQSPQQHVPSDLNGVFGQQRSLSQQQHPQHLPPQSQHPSATWNGPSSSPDFNQDLDTNLNLNSLSLGGAPPTHSNFNQPPHQFSQAFNSAPQQHQMQQQPSGSRFLPSGVNSLHSQPPLPQQHSDWGMENSSVGSFQQHSRTSSSVSSIDSPLKSRGGVGAPTQRSRYDFVEEPQQPQQHAPQMSLQQQQQQHQLQQFQAERDRERERERERQLRAHFLGPPIGHQQQQPQQQHQQPQQHQLDDDLPWHEQEIDSPPIQHQHSHLSQQAQRYGTLQQHQSQLPQHHSFSSFHPQQSQSVQQQQLNQFPPQQHQSNALSHQQQSGSSYQQQDQNGFMQQHQQPQRGGGGGGQPIGGGFLHQQSPMQQQQQPSPHQFQPQAQPHQFASSISPALGFRAPLPHRRPPITGAGNPPQ